MITCRCWLGGEILVAKEKLSHRPSVYAIVRHEDKILMLTTVGNGRYCLPGGGIEPWETIPQALQRELTEEAGIQIAVGSLIHFQEDFFYYDPADEAIHGFLFYYDCTPLTFDLLVGHEVDDEAAENPQWVKVADLHKDNMQPQETWLLNYLSR